MRRSGNDAILTFVACRRIAYVDRELNLKELLIFMPYHICSDFNRGDLLRLIGMRRTQGYSRANTTLLADLGCSGD